MIHKKFLMINHYQALINFMNVTSNNEKPAGIFRGGHQILVRAKLALSDGVTMQLTVRGTDPEVSELVLSTIG